MLQAVKKGKFMIALENLSNNLQPRFGRLATQEEKEQIKQLVRKHMPLAPVNVDHYFIIEFADEFRKRPLPFESNRNRIAQKLSQKDADLLAKTFHKKGTVDVYFLHKVGIPQLPEEIMKAVRSSKILSWLYKKGTEYVAKRWRKLEKYEETVNNQDNSKIVHTVFIQEVGLLRRHRIVRKTNTPKAFQEWRKHHQ